jgi:hypothetical protein
VRQLSDSLAADIIGADGELKGPSPEAWFARLDGEGPGLEEALDWSLEHDHALSSASRVCPFSTATPW